VVCRDRTYPPARPSSAAEGCFAVVACVDCSRRRAFSCGISGRARVCNFPLPPASPAAFLTAPPFDPGGSGARLRAARHFQGPLSCCGGGGGTTSTTRLPCITALLPPRAMSSRRAGARGQQRRPPHFLFPLLTGAPFLISDPRAWERGRSARLLRAPRRHAPTLLPFLRARARRREWTRLGGGGGGVGDVCVPGRFGSPFRHSIPCR
jgi:hypothetical protein